MKTLHTPSPWHKESPIGLQQQHSASKVETLWVVGTKGAPVASWQIPHDLLSSEEIALIHANGRLIAAAPELLAALIEYVERHESAGVDPTGLPEYDQARAAIAKAGGAA